MFLQETKTKRGGKTYISYLVRESFRTANGPRGRTICNLTHLPKEVRDMVGRALKGESMVPLDRLEVNNVHSFGGCVVLEDAARRYGAQEWLAALSQRNGALVNAMIFGGMLFPPSVAPFYVESRTIRLAMFCGLDPEHEHFDVPDLMAALRELDAHWTQVRGLLPRTPQSELRAVAPFKTMDADGKSELAMLGLDMAGIPMALETEGHGPANGNRGDYLHKLSQQTFAHPPLLILDEEIAAAMHGQIPAKQASVIELQPEAVAEVIAHLNPAQLAASLRAGAPVEFRHHGKRYIIASKLRGAEFGIEEAHVTMGSLNELARITAAKPPETPAAREVHGGALSADSLRALHTNLPAEKLSAAAAIAWADRAHGVRLAFSPVQIVIGAPSPEAEVMMWRNHRNLQFLTHWLRCQLHNEWSNRGETRPVEEVLRDLQELHRATLTIDGTVVRRLASHPTHALADLLTKLNLWALFESKEKKPGRC